LPHLEAALLKLSPVDVAALTTMEAAFNMLLRPLELPSEPPSKIVIMVDALDEGDPLEQQQSGFTGGIMAGGNKALNLIVTCFSELPHNIRFIFSSRPDAACDHMQAILQRAFAAKEDGGSAARVTFIEPRNVRVDDDDRDGGSAARVTFIEPHHVRVDDDDRDGGSAARVTFIEPHHVRVDDDDRDGGSAARVTFIEPHHVRVDDDDRDGGSAARVTFIEPHHVRVDDDDRDGGSAARVGSMGRIMVFDTVVKECDLLEDEEQGMLRESVLQVDPLLAVFDMKPPSGVAKNLLQVLIAAQEQLSHSMLQLLGLSNHLESLPGWGCLLYIADHHIYMLHKSLSEWMVDASKSGPHAVDVTAGHRLMGMQLLREVLSLGATSPAAADGRKLFRRTSVGGVEGGLERTPSQHG
ncbi:hypothetical protein CEUSTIGMA_g8225.t1, partial [Chlamydomonas eustigma]